MIKAEKGRVEVAGNEREIIFEYAGITNLFYKDILNGNKDIFMKVLEMAFKIKNDDEIGV